MVLLKALTYIENSSGSLACSANPKVGIMNSCFLLLQQLLVLLLLDAVMYYCTDIFLRMCAMIDQSIGHILLHGMLN